jgi:hypothetical protein
MQANEVAAVLRKPVTMTALRVAVTACFASANLCFAASNALRSAERVSMDCRAVWMDHRYLSFDDRMGLANGTWGRSMVHPPGPSFLRFQHETQRQKDAVAKCLMAK